jgi:hypothetical protein
LSMPSGRDGSRSSESGGPARADKLSVGLAGRQGCARSPSICFPRASEGAAPEWEAGRIALDLLPRAMEGAALEWEAGTLVVGCSDEKVMPPWQPCASCRCLREPVRPSRCL